MKTFLKISLIAILFVKSTSLYANEGELSFKVTNVNEKSISFLFDDEQNVEVSLSGAENELLYSENVKTERASKRIYNLSAFPDGTYTFKVENKLKLAEYKIIIADGKTVISDPVHMDKIKPVISRKKEVVTLNMEHATKGPILVQILNADQEVVYNKVFEGSENFVKRFNISQVMLSELNFVIKFDNQEFSQLVQMY